jgi:hypothetical protein
VSKVTRENACACRVCAVLGQSSKSVGRLIRYVGGYNLVDLLFGGIYYGNAGRVGSSSGLVFYGFPLCRRLVTGDWQANDEAQPIKMRLLSQSQLIHHRLIKPVKLYIWPRDPSSPPDYR